MELVDQEIYDQLLTSKIPHELDLFFNQNLLDAKVSPVRSLDENYGNVSSHSYLKLTKLSTYADMKFLIDKLKQISQKRMAMKKPWDIMAKRPWVEMAGLVQVLEFELMRAITPWLEKPRIEQGGGGGLPSSSHDHAGFIVHEDESSNEVSESPNGVDKASYPAHISLGSGHEVSKSITNGDLCAGSPSPRMVETSATMVADVSIFQDAGLAERLLNLILLPHDWDNRRSHLVDKILTSLFPRYLG